MALKNDQLIHAALAAGDGVARRSDLTHCGVSARVIRRRVAAGLLLALPGGLVADPKPANPHRSQLRAALLSHPTATLGFETALDLHGIRLGEMGDVHLVVPHGCNQAFAGILAHQTRLRSSVDFTVVDGLATTTAARTLVDLASGTTVGRLNWLYQRAVSDRIVDVEELQACLDSMQRARRRGLRRARQVVAGLTDPNPITQSELEKMFWLLARSAGIDGLVAQFRPPWFDGVQVPMK